MYCLLLVTFGNTIGSSHVLVRHHIFYTVFVSEVKVREPHVGAFIVNNASVMGNNPVLTQIV